MTVTFQGRYKASGNQKATVKSNQTSQAVHEIPFLEVVLMRRPTGKVIKLSEIAGGTSR